MITILLLMFSTSSFAAQHAGPSSVYKDFTESCISAFNQSAGTQDNNGKQICECTAEESKHQEVTPKELRIETARIKKDPKYKIANKKLLAAFHVCTISAMEETEHAQ